MFYILTKAVQLIPTEADSVKHYVFKNSFQQFENKVYDYTGIKDLLNLIDDANEFIIKGKIYRFNETLDLPEDNEFDIVILSGDDRKVLFRFTKF